MEYNAKLKEIQILIHSIPKQNFETLKYICDHLNSVSKLSRFNKMTIKNLAIIFGPSLFCANGNLVKALVDMASHVALCRLFIEYSEWLFGPFEVNNQFDAYKEHIEKNIFTVENDHDIYRAKIWEASRSERKNRKRYWDTNSAFGGLEGNTELEQVKVLRTSRSLSDLDF